MLPCEVLELVLRPNQSTHENTLNNRKNRPFQPQISQQTQRLIYSIENDQDRTFRALTRPTLSSSLIAGRQKQFDVIIKREKKEGEQRARARAIELKTEGLGEGETGTEISEIEAVLVIVVGHCRPPRLPLLHRDGMGCFNEANPRAGDKSRNER
ncbi:hypothetical protein GW17_00029989 [Ensete ventricosum]|nr:hypothetical protein GW17_00029989 [Ensete ventricosum]